MNDCYPLDLHMHSTVSDGTDAPEALLEVARRSGLRVFSLTDHDALKGCKSILALRRADDPVFLTGVEFSCRDRLGKYHILGYGCDVEAPAILAVIEQGHAFRIRKLAERLSFLRRQFGFAFSEEETEALYRVDNPGKPHIANLMVRRGYAASREEAFARYLNLHSTPSDYVLPRDAISGILAAGGIPVLAHPCYGDGDQLILGQELSARTERLMGFGLQGLEAYYSGFTPTLRSQVLELADALGLYVTAGSDYHGTNKLINPGDTGLSEDSLFPAGMVRFLQEVRIQ